MGDTDCTSRNTAFRCRRATSAELSICPMPFQGRVLLFTEELRLFNQRVNTLTDLSGRTFDGSLSAQDHKALGDNIELGYKDLASTARRIADLIGTVEAEFGH